jgi:hypothetical protein
MSFLAWTFIFGAAAIIGPILAHLLAKPRFKRVPFTMLRFLKDSHAQSYSRRHIRDILLLLVRCVIIVLIVLIFAQPIVNIKPGQSQTGEIYYLGLDDSISMSYIGGSKSYFERMKSAAIEEIASAETDAVFNIYSLAGCSWMNRLNKQQALAEIQSLKIKTASADIESFLSGINGRKAQFGNNVTVLLISDFTPNILEQMRDVKELTFVDNVRYKIISCSELINNLSIANAQVSDYGGGKLIIDVTISNNGQSRGQSRLSAKKQTKILASTDVDLAPAELRTFPLKIDTGNLGGDSPMFLPIELNLSPDDGLKKDDSFFLAVYLPKQKNINVLLVEANKDEMFLPDTAMQTLSDSGSGNSKTSQIRLRCMPADELSASGLDWANVLVCSGIVKGFNNINQAILQFIQSGGRAVFFITGEPDLQSAGQLYNKGALPAIPVKYVTEQIYPQATPAEKDYAGVDSLAAKAMTNYRIDRILFKGYWKCEPAQDSKCLWQFQNDTGFIYAKQSGAGICILINTSADDSAGSLTKSAVSVALCQYLLGEQDRIRTYCVACDKLSITEGKWIISHVLPSELSSFKGVRFTAPDNDGTGWIKTIDEPVIYAGVNLPDGETDMSKPEDQQIDDVVKRVFSTAKPGPADNISVYDTRNSSYENTLPVWPYLIWTVIILILLESAAANRLKR